MIIYSSFGKSRFGRYLVASTEQGVCSLFFFDGNSTSAEKALRASWPNARIVKKRTVGHASVENFFEKSLSRRRKISLHLKGTPFQLKVWRVLLKIPKGPLTLSILPSKMTSVFSGIAITFFPILLIKFVQSHYHILKRASPPMLASLAILSVIMPLEVDKIRAPIPLLTLLISFALL